MVSGSSRRLMRGHLWHHVRMRHDLRHHGVRIGRRCCSRLDSAHCIRVDHHRHHHHDLTKEKERRSMRHESSESNRIVKLVDIEFENYVPVSVVLAADTKWPP